MDQAALAAVLNSARGYDGQGKYVRDVKNYLGQQKYALREYIKANKQRGKPIHMQDGSIGYGKYRRRRRGRGAYIIPGILGAAKQIGKNIFGLGRYRRRVRRGRGAYGDSVVDQGVPIFANPESTDGPVTVRNREFIKVIYGSQGFVMNTQLHINPGNQHVFPWLSQIAKNFSQYRFEGLSFHFVSTSGNITASQALGSITMACDYDPSGKSIITKQQMMATPFAVSKAPCTDSECPIETAPQQMMNGGLLYVRNHAPQGQDLRFFDLGEFVLATEGQFANGAQLGELWVTYQVALYKPQLSSMEEGGTNEAFMSSYAKWGVVSTGPTEVTATNLWDGGETVWSDGSADAFNNHFIQAVPSTTFITKQSLRMSNMIHGAIYLLRLGWRVDTASTFSISAAETYVNPATAAITAVRVTDPGHGMIVNFNPISGALTYSGYESVPTDGTSTAVPERYLVFTALSSDVYLQLNGAVNPPNSSNENHRLYEAELFRLS